MAEHESSLAVLVDFENMARPGIKGRGDFDIHLGLNRLSDKGRVLVKRAYADWSRYRDARHELQNAGLELIEMPSAREGAKNRADIKMARRRHGARLQPRAPLHIRHRLRRQRLHPARRQASRDSQRVTGMGNRDSTSELLIANCDEFIFYDSLAAAAKRTVGASFDPTEMLRQTLTALQREGTEWPWQAWSRTPCAASIRPSTKPTSGTRHSRSSWRHRASRASSACNPTPARGPTGSSRQLGGRRAAAVDRRARRRRRGTHRTPAPASPPWRVRRCPRACDGVGRCVRVRCRHDRAGRRDGVAAAGPADLI